jgi:hypothetical protein
MFLRKDKKSFEILEERASELRSIGNKCGFQEICTYAIDEAKPQIIKEELPLWREINKQGVGIYVAGIKDVAFQFAANLDILVANGKLSKEAAAEMHKYGHKIFSYSNPQSAPECPKLFRLNYGIKLWLNNYDGAMTYAYQSAFGNVWNDFDGHVQKYRDEVFAYPTSNGLVSTMSWEAYRQAKQDIMYASMLIKLIDKCCRSENKEKLPLALEARNYLENLKLDINSDLDDVRNKIIDFIVELR